MRNSKSVLVVLAVAGFAGVCFLAGCSDSKNRQSVKDLNQAITNAQLLGQRALALMANPYVRDTQTGQTFPMKQPLADSTSPEAIKASPNVGRIELHPVTEVNPTALDLLKSAKDELTKAIAANPPVEGDDVLKKKVAQAQETLASVHKLLGRYYASVFANESTQIDAALGGINAAYNRAIADRDAAKILDGIVKADTSSSDKVLQDTSKALKDLQDQVKAKEEELTSLNAKRTELEARINTLREQFSKLTREGQDIGTEAEKKLEEALTIRDEFNKQQMALLAVGQQIQTAENAKAVAEADAKVLGGQDAAAGVIGSAQATVTAQKATVATVEGLKKNAQDSMKDARSKIAEAMKQLTASYNAAQSASSEALTNYAQGLKLLSQAAAVGRSFQNLAEQGAMNMDSANLGIQTRTLQLQVQDQLKQVVAGWSSIDGEGELQAVKVTDPEPLRVAAVKNLKEAAEAYQLTLSTLSSMHTLKRSDVEWAYKAAQAAAWMKLAAISPEDKNEAVRQATTLISEAREGKQYSPNLANVNKLNEILPGL